MTPDVVQNHNEAGILYEILHGEHIPEWLTGVSTLMLFVSTLLLVVVTYLLAKITREDGLYRRREATTTAWMKIRADMDVPDLRGKKREEVMEEGVKSRPLLRQLEAFSTLINAKVYDINTFNRISGGWFVRNFEKIEPYVQIRHQEMSHSPYSEMIMLNRDLIKLRGKSKVLESLLPPS